jgi:glutathione S-transferase/RNA polymerase-associated protein
VQLHDNPFSPFAFKVRAALYEKGVDFEKCEIRRHSQREALLRVNPRGEVPALVDDGTPITDSKVICAYLEDRFPAPALLPTEPLLRARCRQLELKSDTDLDACAVVLGTLLLFRPKLSEEHPEALARTLEVLDTHYAWFERELGDRDWFCGEFSLADIAIAPHVLTTSFMQHPPGAEHPRLLAWLSRVRERESVARATREMAEGYQAATNDADSLFDPGRLHWRNDRIECLLRVGLGGWLLEELAADRAFFSPLAR